MNQVLETFSSIQNVWRKNNFPDMNMKPKQVIRLESIRLGKYVIAVLPTGYGCMGSLYCFTHSHKKR